MGKRREMDLRKRIFIKKEEALGLEKG